MEAILLALSPVLVSFLTGQAKKLPSIKVKENNKPALRLLAAVLSAGAAVVLAVLSGQAIDENVAQVLVNAFVAFIGSQGWFHLTK